MMLNQKESIKKFIEPKVGTVEAKAGTIKAKVGTIKAKVGTVKPKVKTYRKKGTEKKAPRSRTRRLR
jgi:hypothetical protein